MDIYAEGGAFLCFSVKRIDDLSLATTAADAGKELDFLAASPSVLFLRNAK